VIDDPTDLRRADSKKSGEILLFVLTGRVKSSDFANRLRVELFYHVKPDLIVGI